MKHVASYGSRRTHGTVLGRSLEGVEFVNIVVLRKYKGKFDK